MHRLVVYKRGPMLLMMVVNATGMKQTDTSDAPDSKQAEPSDAQRSVTSSSSSGPVQLGKGAKSLPAFCRLLHKHAGKPLGQLTSMLEGGYAKLDTRRFNAASPGGQTNFAYSDGAGADGGKGNNIGSSSGKGRRSSRQSGSSSSSIRSEYRFVYFNGACCGDGSSLHDFLDFFVCFCVEKNMT
jgi:hypothetical protein